MITPTAPACHALKEGRLTAVSAGPFLQLVNDRGEPDAQATYRVADPASVEAHGDYLQKGGRRAVGILAPIALFPVGAVWRHCLSAWLTLRLSRCRKRERSGR
jgi:hypothetical protein